jgi:hypothetical protein
MRIEPQTILGRELRVGDVIQIWTGRRTVTHLFPYIGPLAYLWDSQGGAQIAAFAESTVGMTIEPIARFTVINREVVGA